MRTIKRYSNRKHYDTTDSCYRTLEQIGDLVRQGEDVKIIENQTERDLTAATLAQVIADQEKRSPRIPVADLQKLIRSGLALD